MAQTPSKMLPLGTKAVDFSLIDTRSDQIQTLQALKSDIATVVMFICNHCPYVIHIMSVLSKVAGGYQGKGIQFIAISSNDVDHYPEDSPEEMKTFAARYDFSFPYLYDASQATANAYQAACTPDFYVFDAELACVYRGRFDESTPGNSQPVTGHDLTTALDAILQGTSINPQQLPSVGCNIKWKK